MKQLNDKDIVSFVDLTEKSPGFKFAEHEVNGIPVRIEIGPRDLENNQAVLVRRDSGEKEVVELSKLDERLESLLEEIQKDMFNVCKERRIEKTKVATTLDEMIKLIEDDQCFLKTMWCEDEECENKVKELTGAHSRCIPFEQEHISDTCPICGKKATKMIVWGRQY